MYRMRSQRISPYKLCSLEKISPFCRMILKIAHRLSEDEVSQLKLALLVDNHVTIREKAELRNGAEVMIYLYNRNLISKTEASFLIELLKQINRVDLATLVENHFKEDLNVALEAVAISSRPLSESATKEPYSFRSTIGETSRESSNTTFPNPFPRLDSKDHHHHIHSVTDEETLQIHDQNALHISYEHTNQEKVSLKTSKSYGHVLSQLKEANMSETLSSSQSSQISMDDTLSLSQDSLMSISDDEKFSQIEKSAFLRTDDCMEAFLP